MAKNHSDLFVKFFTDFADKHPEIHVACNVNDSRGHTGISFPGQMKFLEVSFSTKDYGGMFPEGWINFGFKSPRSKGFHKTSLPLQTTENPFVGTVDRITSAPTTEKYFEMFFDKLSSYLEAVVCDIVSLPDMMLCPKCFNTMLIRIRRLDGKAFWGCSCYPTCKFSMNMSPKQAELYVRYIDHAKRPQFPK